MTTTIDQLVDAAASSDDERTEAAVAQVRAENEPELLALLETADQELRWWIAYALARCGGALSVTPLVALLEDDDAAIRAAAALGLAHIRQRTGAAVSAAALSSVGQLLQDEEGFVRQAASDALALCGDSAVPALHAALQGAHEGARTRAMLALRKIATVEAAKIMFQHLNDANYLVRTVAFEGLDEMGLLENVLLKP